MYIHVYIYIYIYTCMSTHMFRDIQTLRLLTADCSWRYRQTADEETRTSESESNSFLNAEGVLS